MNLKSNVGLAAAAAMFALSAGATSAVHAEKAKAETVHCFGVNSCKGTSDCKSYNHDCKGMNDCKGQGFKAESAKMCAADGGTTTQP